MQYHQRLNTLDDQIKHLDELSWAKLGKWLRSKWRDCEHWRTSLEGQLKKNGNEISLLREEWQKQVAAQTKPLPSMSSACPA